MRVLWVSPSYAPFLSGAQRFSQAMTECLVASRHSVTLLTTNARCADDFWRPPSVAVPPLPAHETLQGVRVERLTLAYPWPSPYTFGVLRRLGLWLHLNRLPVLLVRLVQYQLARWMPPLPGLEESLKRLVPDVDLVQIVDASWDGLLVTTARAARMYSKPLVVCPLMHLGDSDVRAHFQMAHQVDVYRQAAAILVLSSREASAMVALGVDSARVHCLKMGVDSSVEFPSAAEVVGFRAQYQGEGALVAFVGANTYDKGAFDLAQAVAQLNQEGLAVNVAYAGSQSEKLRAFLRGQPLQVRTALEGRVRILGMVDEQTKQRLLAACDLLALPSQVDTFGIVLLEAWLHAKPVIGAKAGGIPDLVQSEKTGLLVPFGDVTALTVAIHRLLTEPKLAARLGAAGRQQVLRRYTWDQTYRTLVDIYEQVLSAA